MGEWRRKAPCGSAGERFCAFFSVAASVHGVVESESLFAPESAELPHMSQRRLGSSMGRKLVLSGGLGTAVASLSGCQGPALWGNLALVALTVGIFLSTLTLRK
jgi:hypothetical protein